MADLIYTFSALAAVQVLLYRVKPNEALRRFWALGVLYLALFLITKGLHIICSSGLMNHFPSLSPLPLQGERDRVRGCELIFLLVLIWLVYQAIARGTGSRHEKVTVTKKSDSHFFMKPVPPRTGTAKMPDFYLLTTLWVGLAWFSYPVRDFRAGFLWSFLGAGLLPILSAIKERLDLSDQPEWFAGLPAFLTAAGLFLLGFSALVR